MTTSTVAPEIVAFARGVRAALADLPAEEVDDLTDGLEADLAESLAEDLRRTLPDPVAYAAELRLAAGLPGPGGRRGTRGDLGDLARTARERLTAVTESNPALASVVELVSELRPVWWFVRAWVATWLMAAFFGMERSFGFDGAWWVVLVGLAVVSVQWGRGRWGFPARRELVQVGNVVAALALLPVLTAAMSWGSVSGGDYESGYQAGLDSGYGESGSALQLDGEPVSNLYAYDAAGQPLTGVQLFDQAGRPIDPFGLAPGDGQPCTDDECSSLFVPSLLATGQSVYNVFPLSAVAGAVDENTGQNAPAVGATAAAPPAPFVQVPAVQAAQPVATPNE